MSIAFCFDSDCRTLDRACRVALGDVQGNVKPYRAGLLTSEKPCLFAGLDYDHPWTRDAALNTWYAAAMLMPDVSQTTLLSVVEHDGDNLLIGGEYWDAMIWVMGAWHHYLWTGNRYFLRLAYTITLDSMRRCESRERDPQDGLFRGGACFQDGVSGYPDFFADGPSSGIADWVKAHPEARVQVGHGLPLKALSTNIIHYQAYLLMAEMAHELGEQQDPDWYDSAARLKTAINQRFWDADAGLYRYLVDAPGETDHREGFGHAFALLFGVADPVQARSVVDNLPLTPHGVACVWPTYSRYALDEHSFGRHSGTIWPQVSAAWVLALVGQGQRDMAWRELRMLAERACRDHQFSEVYHPLTGEIYAGLQEWYDGGPIRPWPACHRQTWCATGYVAMLMATLTGMKLDVYSIQFDPWLPPEMQRAEFSGIRYRGAEINLVVERGGPPGVTVNGDPLPLLKLDRAARGSYVLHAYVV